MIALATRRSSTLRAASAVTIGSSGRLIVSAETGDHAPCYRVPITRKRPFRGDTYTFV
jgi:hypothetical protein